MDKSCGRLALRFTAVLFTIFIVVCVAVGVTLIFTQKPVDISNGVSRHTGKSKGDPTGPPQTINFRSRKKFPANYRKFTFDDLISSNPITITTYQHAWLSDGSALLKEDSPCIRLLQFFSERLSFSTNRQQLGEELKSTHTLRHAIDMRFEDSETLNIIPIDSHSENAFIPNEEFVKLGFLSEKVKFSSSGKYAALYKHHHYGFRYSKDAAYTIARVSNGKFLNIKNVGPKGNGTEIIQEFTWNPDPKSDTFVFISGNTVYYQEDPEKEGSARKLSSNGSDFVHYGVADWLYEEDVFTSSLAHWWSPSGRQLSYIKFDDEDVNKVFIRKYYPGVQYPEYKPIPYPKAGVKEQPKVKLYLWNRTTSKRVVVSPPAELNNQSYYIYSVGWLKATDNRTEKLVTVWANRAQEVVYFTLCDSTDCVMAFEQRYEFGGRKLWAQPAEVHTIYSSSTGFYTLLPAEYTDGNIYTHLAHVQVDEGGIGSVSSSHGGPYDISALSGYDEELDSITYMAMGGGIATQRLYRVNDASSQNSSITCLSCVIERCDSSAVTVSPTGKRALLTCRATWTDAKLYIQDVQSPHDFVVLRGQKERSLDFDPPSTRHETIRLPSGIDAHVGLILPPQLDSSLKYPLFLHVYGGPTSYANSLETPWDFLLYLCSNEQMVIAFVDGRGSGNRGWNIKEPVANNLGVPETEDQIEAVKALLDKYEFLDGESVTVFGWSYGGFLSSHIAVLDQGRTFGCAIAVAPVADFTLYDSAYTERYLGLLEANPVGYNNSRLIDKMHRIGNNVSYMLAHGEADDNVHYHHSALLSQSLQMANIHFTQLVYANQDHAMASVRQHLYSEVTRFLNLNCRH